MENTISDAYNLIQNLRKLQNDAGHNFDIDHHNLIQAIKHLGVFYQELVQAAIDDQKRIEVATDKKRKEDLIKRGKSLRQLAKEAQDAEDLRKYYLGSDQPA